MGDAQVSSDPNLPAQGCARIALFIFGVLFLVAVIIYATWPR
jgi:hypothetical protein